MGSRDELVQGKDGMWAVCFRNHLNQDESEIRLIFTQYGDVGPIRSSGVWTFVRFNTKAEARASMDDPGIQSSLGDVVKAARCTKTELAAPTPQNGEFDDADEPSPSPNSNFKRNNFGGGQQRGAPGNFQQGPSTNKKESGSDKDPNSDGQPLYDKFNRSANNRPHPTTNATANTGKTPSGPTNNFQQGSRNPQARQANNYNARQAPSAQGGNESPNNQVYPDDRQQQRRPLGPSRGPNSGPRVEYNGPNNQVNAYLEDSDEPQMEEMPLRRPPGPYKGPNQLNLGHRLGSNGPNNRGGNSYAETGDHVGDVPPVRRLQGQYGGLNPDNFTQRFVKNGSKNHQANSYVEDDTDEEYQPNIPARRPTGGMYGPSNASLMQQQQQQGFTPYNVDNSKPSFNQKRSPNEQQFPDNRYRQNDGNFSGKNSTAASTRQPFRGPNAPPQQGMASYPLGQDGVPRNPPRKALNQGMQQHPAQLPSKFDKPPPPLFQRHQLSVAASLERNLAKLGVRGGGGQQPPLLTHTVQADQRAVYVSEDGQDENGPPPPPLVSLQRYHHEQQVQEDEEQFEEALADIVIANYPQQLTEEELWVLFGPDIVEISTHKTKTNMAYCHILVGSTRKMHELLSLDSYEVLGRKLYVSIAEDVLAIGFTKLVFDRTLAAAV